MFALAHTASIPSIQIVNTRTLRGPGLTTWQRIAPHPPRPGLARRLLGSPVVDLLLGPHGVDRYLELISPTLTVTDARAEVVAVRRQTAAQRDADPAAQPRLGRLSRRPVRRRRRRDRRRAAHPDLLPGGLGAPRRAAGADRHRAPRRSGLGPPAARGAHRSRSCIWPRAQGMFTLPEPRPERLVLISGGSGITPVLSMLRTLVDEGHDGEIAFLHFARTEADWLYEPEVRALAARHPGLRVAYRTTRGAAPEPARRRRAASLIGDARRRHRRRLRPAGPGRRRPGGVGRAGRRPRPAARPRPSRRRACSSPATAADRDAALPAQRSHRADRRGHAARAGRGGRALARVRLPDGHLPHLHLPQGRRRGAQPAHRRRSQTRTTRTSSCASRPRPATSRWSSSAHRAPERT